jgi:negative regulator of sigma E activity
MRRTLAVCALAAVLALTGCAGRGRAHADLQPAGHTTAQQTAPAAKPATSAAKSDDTAADLVAVDSQLNGLDKQLSNLNTQLTDADKAADDDN